MPSTPPDDHYIDGCAAHAGLPFTPGSNNHKEIKKMPDDKNIANEYLELHRRLLDQLAKATAVKESMERMEQEIEAQIHKVQASYGNYLAQKVLYGNSGEK